MNLKARMTLGDFYINILSGNVIYLEKLQLFK